MSTVIVMPKTLTVSVTRGNGATVDELIVYPLAAAPRWSASTTKSLPLPGEAIVRLWPACPACRPAELWR